MANIAEKIHEKQAAIFKAIADERALFELHPELRGHKEKLKQRINTMLCFLFRRVCAYTVFVIIYYVSCACF